MTKTQESASTLIPTRLRHALRLIHCLQKERGVSSSFYAAHLNNNDNHKKLSTKRLSGIGLSLQVALEEPSCTITTTTAEAAAEITAATATNTNSLLLFDDFLESTMKNAREGTDAAFIMFLSSTIPNHSNGSDGSTGYRNIGLNWEKSLKRVRMCVDAICKCVGDDNHDNLNPDNDEHERNDHYGHYTHDCTNNNEDKTLYTSNDDADSAGGYPTASSSSGRHFQIQTTTTSTSSSSTATPSHFNNPNISSHIVGSHRIVVMFNLLIGNMIDEAVIQVVQNEQHLLTKSTTNTNNHHHHIENHNRIISNSSSDYHNNYHPNQNQHYDHSPRMVHGSSISSTPSSSSINQSHMVQQTLLLNPQGGGVHHHHHHHYYHHHNHPRIMNKSSSLVTFGIDGINENQSIHYHNHHTPPDSMMRPNETFTSSYGTANNTSTGSMNNKAPVNSTLSRSLPSNNYYDDLQIVRRRTTIGSGGGHGQSSGAVAAVSLGVGEIDNTHHTTNHFSLRQSNSSSSTTSSPNNAYNNTNENFEQHRGLRGNKLRSSLIINNQGSKQKHRLNYLMSLLLSFVRLKESIGLERAILSNLMASNPDNGLPKEKKLLTGLVVEDANQRKIIRELQSQSKELVEKRYGHKVSDAVSSLLSLMEDMVRPSKEVDQLQEMIRTHFNLAELRKAMSFTKFWQKVTVYMDKLHSIELLLLEEMQSMWVMLTLSKSMNDDDDKKKNLSHGSFTSLLTSLQQEETNADKQYIYNILLPNGDDSDSQNGLTDKQRIGKISQMPSEQVKRLLMSHLTDDNSSSITSPRNEPEPIFTEDEVVGLPQPKNIPNLHIAKEWDIDLYEIDFRKKIGRGVGGTTYLAEWSGQNVAVKVASITDLGLEGWSAEVNSLQRLHHPNVIRLLGSIYNASPQTYGLVLEYCESGDLSTALTNATPSNFFWRVAEDVAKGMNYLHRKNILHRDIKPANVLLSGNVPGGNFIAKLSDFGVAIMHHGPAGEEHTAETGTYRWMPPEIIRHEVYSYAADVYSYALVVWQLVTHELPFKKFSQIEAAGKVAVERARPPFPAGTPGLIIALIETCWRENPDERLSFAQILIELKEIFKVLSDRDKLWLSVPEGHPVYDLPKITVTSERRLSSSTSENDWANEGHNGDHDSYYSRQKNSRRSRRHLYRSKSPRRSKSPHHRSKSPHNSNKGGGLFSIFHSHRNR